MSLRIPLLAAAAAALLLAAAGVAVAERGAPSPILWVDDPAHEAGPVATAYAVQQRGYYSITTQIHTAGLTPGHRYTLWWAVYNQPAACVDGCGLDDVAAALADPAANPAGVGVQYGGTFVAASNGRMNVATRILEHATVGCAEVPPFDLLCNPLIDAATAESTVFIQYHGPAGDAALPPAAEMFSFGCKAYMRGGVAVTSYGATGVDCYTAQEVPLP